MSADFPVFCQINKDRMIPAVLIFLHESIIICNCENYSAIIRKQSRNKCIVSIIHS